MLKMNQGVKLQLPLDFLHLLGIRFEDVVHIVSAIKVTGIVGKISAAHLLDFLKLGPLCLHLLRDGSDELIDTIFLPFRVQNNQAFVFPVLRLFSWVSILVRVLFFLPWGAY